MYIHGEGQSVLNMKPNNLLFQSGKQDDEQIYIMVADIGYGEINKS